MKQKRYLCLFGKQKTMISQIIDDKLIIINCSLINSVERDAITCHKSPDGDALGSTLALVPCFAPYGASDAIVVTPDMAPKAFEFVPGVRDIVVFTRQETPCKTRAE